jgi:FkbM family methyltransferase
MSQSQPILFDIHTGKITGAHWHEWLALRLMGLAVRLMQPFHLFGFSYVARTVRTVLPSRRKVIFQLDADSRMLTDYCDAYWSVLLMPGFPYETENANLIASARDVNYGFIDGGANHGFWSALVTGKAAAQKPVVAIEAASDTFDRLEQNRALNNKRFVALNRAIGAVSGERVLIYGAKHEARSTIAPDEKTKPILDCISISLDDVAVHEQFAGLTKFIVKLDVEGVEIAAMTAATKLQNMDTVFIYEDHGSDQSHETTRHVMDALGMQVFWLGREEPATKILDVKQMDAIKRSRRFGYDFAASKSPFWIERLNAMVQNAPQHDARIAA